MITEENKQQILDPLPVSRIWGIGRVTDKALEKVGIRTVAQLRTAPRYQLNRVFGNQVDDILRLAQGTDNRKVEPYSEAKSISAEETFAVDIGDGEMLSGILLQQIEEVSHGSEKINSRHAP